MRKRLMILCVLTGIAAFAFSFSSCKPAAAPNAKVKKNAHRSAIAPLADLALLPALNG